jgi:hypothetical protein
MNATFSLHRSALLVGVLVLSVASTASAHPNHHGKHRRHRPVRVERVEVVTRPAPITVRANIRVGPVRVVVPMRHRPRPTRYVVVRDRHDYYDYVEHDNHPIYYYDRYHDDCRYLGDDLFESEEFGIHYHDYD